MRKSFVIEQINVVFTYITNNNDNSEATLFSISVLVAEKDTKDQNVLCSVCCCKSEYYVYLLYTNLVAATFYSQ